MNYKKIVNYLYSLETPEIKLGLDSINSLLGEIGNPEKSLRCIHVAGTNGKGSVCSMIFYILREAGFKAGMYTSPHLKKFNERIRINDDLITDGEIARCFLKIKPHIKNQSFFEITTAMAFLYFKEQNVDYAVLEVGLGGRLDATNVVTPLISVITNIGLEHTDILGKTIEKISFEKAGIIKKNVPIVTGANGKALGAIRQISKARNAPLFLPDKFEDVKFDYLSGAFQQRNKDIALTTIGILKNFHKIKISRKQIICGIKKTKWKGRLEFLSKNVLIDCAHNPDGFKILMNELLIIKKDRKIKNFIFVLGMQNDKDIGEMLRIISPLASAVIFTKSESGKASKPEELARIFNRINKNKKIIKKITINPKKALDCAKKISGKNDLVVVAGSIYMVGEVI